MLRRSNCLPFLVLASFTIILYLSCSQSPDIVTPIATTDIALSAERLPTPPPGMVYELWVAKSGDTVSLGKFSYNGDTRSFLDLQGAARTDTFVLKGDIFTYSQVFVSIEQNPDPDPASPGPIMLTHPVTDPNQEPMRLRFPEADSLWMSTLRVNFQTPTDLSRTTNLGHGIWFSRYQTRTINMPDTTAQYWTLVDSTNDDSTQFPFTYACSVSDTSLDSALVDLGGPDFLWMGANLPVHHGVSFKRWFCVDSTPPFEGQVVTAAFDTVSRAFVTDWYDESGTILPVLSQFGWHYKGWIVTPYNEAGMTSMWRFTKPAYRYNSPNEQFIPGDSGVLFSTGTFYNLNGPDNSNRFSLANPAPPFPGEDFLNSDTLQRVYGIDSVNFLPLANGNSGTVFISLEPDNYLTDTTNFPLIAMVARVPGSRALIGATNSLGSFDMSNFTSTITGNTIGFPTILVSIKRF